MKNARKIVNLLLVVFMMFGTLSAMAVEQAVVSSWTGGTPTAIEDDVPYEGYTGTVVEKAETESKLPFSYSPMIPVEDGVTYFYKLFYKGNPEFVIVYYGIKDGEDGKYLGEAKNAPGKQDAWYSYTAKFVASHAAGEVTAVQIGIRNRRTDVTCRFSEMTIEQRMTAEITDWTLSEYTTKNEAEGTITHDFNNNSGKNVVIAKTTFNATPGKAYRLSFEHTASSFDSAGLGKYLYPMVRTYFYTNDYSVALQTDYKTSGTVNYVENYAAESISYKKHNLYSYQTIQYPTQTNQWAKSVIYFVVPNTTFDSALIQLLQPSATSYDGTATIRNVMITEDTSAVSFVANETELGKNEIVSNGKITVNYHYVHKNVLAFGQNPNVNFIAAIYKVDGTKKSLCSVNIIKDKALLEKVYPDPQPKFGLLVPQDAVIELDVPELESGNYEIKVMAWDEFSILSANSKTFVHTATYTAE